MSLMAVPRSCLNNSCVVLTATRGQACMQDNHRRYGCKVNAINCCEGFLMTARSTLNQIITTADGVAAYETLSAPLLWHISKAIR